MDILNGQFIDFMMTQLQIDLLPQTINAKMRIAGLILVLGRTSQEKSMLDC